MTSRLNIAEYQGGNYAGIQAPVAPPLIEQAFVDFTDGAAHQCLAAFGGDTHMVEISTNAACHVLCGGKNPTASLNSQFLPAGGLRVYIVTPGDKLSVIAES